MLHGRRMFVIPILALLALFAVLAATVISSNRAQATNPNGKFNCQKMGKGNTSRFFICILTNNAGPADSVEFDMISKATGKPALLVNKVTVVRTTKVANTVDLGWEVGIGGTKATPLHGYANTTVKTADCNVAHTTDNHVSMRRKAGTPTINKGQAVVVNIFLCQKAKGLQVADLRWQLAGALVAESNPSPTKGPTATPKPLATGKLSGVYDIWVTAGEYPNAFKDAAVFLCIGSVQHEALPGAADTAERMKVSVECKDDQRATIITGLGDPNSALNGINVPGEGGDFLPGPPASTDSQGPPAKGSGTYNEATDTVTFKTCHKNIPGSNAPNIISEVTVLNALNQLQTTGKQHGSVSIFGKQSNKQCRDLTPSGAILFNTVLNVKLHPADKNNPSCSGAIQPKTPPTPNNPAKGVGCQRVPWRVALPAAQDPAGKDDVDYDNDGCTDAQELDKTGTLKCGDSPWNGTDSLSPANLNGSWYILVKAREADACVANSWDGQNDSPQLYNCNGAALGTFVPGAYYSCYTYITQVVKALTADVLCYIDFGPDTTATPPTLKGLTAVGPGTPLSINKEQCAAAGFVGGLKCSGDGRSGAAPPGGTGWGVPMFADIAKPIEPNGVGKHTHLTGEIDNVKNTIHLKGCFQDADKQGSLGWVYVNVILDLHTRDGKADIWSFQTQANCENGTPAPGLGFLAPQALLAEAVQLSADLNRDSDQDSCPDMEELQDDPTQGGLRDPSNPWDWMNPANNSIVLSADITQEVNHYGLEPGGPAGPFGPYEPKFNRGGTIFGSNKWNFLPPDTIILSADITSAVDSYGHECGTGLIKPTVTPTQTPVTGNTPTQTPSVTPKVGP